MQKYFSPPKERWGELQHAAHITAAPVPSFHVCLSGLRFIRALPLNLSVCFASSFSRCIHSPSQVSDPQSVHLLPVCPPSRLQKGSCSRCQNRRSEGKTLLPSLLMRVWPSSSVHIEALDPYRLQEQHKCLSEVEVTGKWYFFGVFLAEQYRRERSKGKRVGL